MSQIDWARKYAEMDKRIAWKYERLPNGEQVGSGQNPSIKKQPDRK